MTRKTRDIESSLLRKGFREDGRKNHHVYFRFFHKGKKTSVYTYFSHSATDVGSPLISMMAKQLKLDKAGFLDLIDCPMDVATYTSRLLAGDICLEVPEESAEEKKHVAGKRSS